MTLTKTEHVFSIGDLLTITYEDGSQEDCILDLITTSGTFICIRREYGEYRRVFADHHKGRFFEYAGQRVPNYQTFNTSEGVKGLSKRFSQLVKDSV